jgi:hypothetical protein
MAELVMNAKEYSFSTYIEYAAKFPHFPLHVSVVEFVM